MTNNDPHAASSQNWSGPNHLPAVPQSHQQTALGNPLPAAPWVEAKEGNEGFDFGGFLHSLRRRWLSGVAIGLLLASILAALLWILVPVKSEAIVLIRVRRNQEDMLDKDRPTNPQDYEIFKQTQAALLKSTFVITRALSKPGISQLPLVRDEPWGGQREKPDAWLAKQLKVRFSEDSEVLMLSMRDRYPEQLKKLLNAVTDSYMKEIVQAEQARQVGKLDTLRSELRRTQDEMRETLRQISELAKTYGSTENDQIKLQIDLGFKKLAELERERMQVQREYHDVQNMLVITQKRMQQSNFYSPRDFEIEDVLRTYPDYQSLEVQLIAAKQEMDLRNAQTRGPFAGANQALQEQIAMLQSRLEEIKANRKGEVVERLRMASDKDHRQLREEIDMLQTQYQITGARLQRLMEARDAQEQKLREMGAFSEDLELRRNQYESLKMVSEELSQKISELQLKMRAKSQIEVLQSAEIPDEDSWFMKYLQIGGAWTLALIGTVLGLALWDLQGKRVNSSKEVTSEIRVVGSLPLLNGRRVAGLLPMSESARRTLEVGLTRSIDSIRTSLLFAKSNDPLQVVMITSSLGQEGKTTVASQLAVSLARSGRRTLLIDGDIRNPQQHVVLGMPFGQGLCELLRGEAQLEDVIQATAAEGLWCLSPGHRDINTDQVLASPLLRQVFEEIRSRFDFVVIDTGPVLTSPDPLLLGQLVDTAILSVRRDESRLPKVTEACDRLRSVGIHIFGAVLNGAGMDIRESELQLTPQDTITEERQLESVS